MLRTPKPQSGKKKKKTPSSAASAPFSVHSKGSTDTVKRNQRKAVKQQKHNLLLKKRQRTNDSVDAWDTGAAERKEHERAKAQHSGKRFKFDPAPATFQLPSREEQLRKKMGDFAGPLLGTLWEEDDAKQQQPFVYVASEATTDLKKTNQFSALASSSSSDEDDSEKKTKPPSVMFFNPPTLNDIPKLKPAAATNPWKISSSSSMFQPASFDAEQLKRPQQQQVVAASFAAATFEFKPPTFQAEAASGKLEKDDDWDNL